MSSLSRSEASTPGLAPNPATTAPKDGRVIKGYFVHNSDAGADMIAVSWDPSRDCWVNLIREPVPEHLRLEAWGEH